MATDNTPSPALPQERVPSAEEIAGSVRAAFDSVSLCNDLVGKGVKNTETKGTVERNKAHLEIMLGKTWFADALTTQQRTDIDAAIADSEAFIA